MHNKVTIEEPEERGEVPEWKVNALYEKVEGCYVGRVFVATTEDDLIDLSDGEPYTDLGGRFGTGAHRFRRLPPGTKVTITVGGEEP